MKTSPCRACKAPMVWATTLAGRAQPFDPEPDSNGNTVLVAATKAAAVDGPKVIAIPLSGLTDEARGSAERAGVALFMPHHATCPQRDQFKRS